MAAEIPPRLGESARGHPSVADIDGLPGEEIVEGTASQDYAAFTSAGTPVPGWPKLSSDWSVANPLIGTLGTRDTDAGAGKVVITMTPTAPGLASTTTRRTRATTRATPPGAVTGLAGTDGGSAVRGLDGDDRIRAAAGDDCLAGNGGDDRVSGSRRDDSIRGNSGDDRLEGGPGGDAVRGNGGGDRLRGKAGDDDLRAGSGRDRVSAGDGDDAVNVRGGGRDRVSCGKGTDSVKAGRDDEVARDCERVRVF